MAIFAKVYQCEQGGQIFKRFQPSVATYIAVLRGFTDDGISDCLKALRMSNACGLSNRFRKTGTTSDCPRPGRPSVTTRRQDRYIRSSHLRNRFRPATVIARTTPGRIIQSRISAQTVRNRLQDIGVKCTAHLQNIIEVIEKQ